MSGFRLRAVSHDELPALVALVNSAYRGDASRSGWTSEADLLGGQRTDIDSLASMLAEPGAEVLVCADAEGLSGCVFLERTSDSSAPVAGQAAVEAYLGMLTVRPRGQAAGLGSAILAGAEAHAKAAWGARAMRMTVIAQRSELLAWYERRGYVRTGETEPFPYGDARFGLPMRDDLVFLVLRKSLA